MRWHLWVLLFLVLAGAGLAAARAAQWAPVAPDALPAGAWTPTVASDPTSWQTLANATFEAGGGSFVAELQGFRKMTATSLHSLQVRIVRTGGDDARIWVYEGRLDGASPTRVTRIPGELEVVFGIMPYHGELSLAADLEVRVWRPIAVGYVEEEAVPIRLAAEVRGPDPP